MKYEIAETHTGIDKDGNKSTIANFERVSKDPSAIERFLAYNLYQLGIKEICGYRTMKTVGMAESFDNETGKSKGRVVLQNYGFEKKNLNNL